MGSCHALTVSTCSLSSACVTDKVSKFFWRKGTVSLLNVTLDAPGILAIRKLVMLQLREVGQLAEEVLQMPSILSEKVMNLP